MLLTRAGSGASCGGGGGGGGGSDDDTWPGTSSVRGDAPNTLRLACGGVARPSCFRYGLLRTGMVLDHVMMENCKPLQPRCFRYRRLRTAMEL